jgi:hypothetical protein
MFALSLIRVRVLLALLCGVQCSLHSMEIIEKDQKKERIEDFIRRKTTSVTGSQIWNKDYSKCAWVTFDTNASGAKDLKLTVVGLVGDGKRVVSNSRLWRDFYFPVFEDDVRPFFDKDGRVCFYGYGNREDQSGQNCSFVGEYSIDVDGTAEHYECLCHIPSWSISTDSFVTLTGLLHFPILMKALLQSTNISKCKFADGCRKAFYPDPSNFLANFTLYKQHLGLEKFKDEVGEVYALAFNKYKSYYDLPMNLRNAFQVQGW